MCFGMSGESLCFSLIMDHCIYYQDAATQAPRVAVCLSIGATGDSATTCEKLTNPGGTQSVRWFAVWEPGCFLGRSALKFL